MLSLPLNSGLPYATMLLCASTAIAAEWHLSPDGLDMNPGTSNAPFATITRAQSVASFGDTVWLRGGTYVLDNSHLTATNPPWAIVNNLTKDGVRYLALPGAARPVFDFSAVQPMGYRVTAFYVTADDCVFEGFDVVGVQVTIRAGEASNTQSECFRVHGGDRNRFERLVMRDGMGIGWYLTRGADNLVLNCDASNNRGLDSLSMGNVDGFGAHPDRTSGTGNIFRGCRAWFNSDDGFDLINADAAVVIENCWSFYNGYLTNFASSGGDGHGFKSGGYGVSGNSYPVPVPRHVTRFCLAVRNRVHGFYANHHTGGLDWINNTGYRNSANYNMLCNLNAQGYSNDVPGFDHVMKNNLGFLGNAEVTHLGLSNDVSFNYFTLPVAVQSNDFLALDESLLTAPRLSNGDLPYIAFAQLVSGSDLKDAGMDAGLAFAGPAPDLGVFEYGINPPPTLAIAREGLQMILSASGGPAGGAHHLVATTNLALPIHEWSEVATGQFDLEGDCTITNVPLMARPMQVYSLRLP